MTQKDLITAFAKQSEESESYLRSEFPADVIEHVQQPQNWLWLSYAVRSEVRSYYGAFSRDFLDQPPSAIRSILKNLDLAEVLRKSEENEIILIRRSGIERTKRTMHLPSC